MPQCLKIDYLPTLCSCPMLPCKAIFKVQSILGQTQYQCRAGRSWWGPNTLAKHGNTGSEWSTTKSPLYMMTPKPTWKKNDEGDICYLGQDTGINIPNKQKRARLPQSLGVELSRRAQIHQDRPPSEMLLDCHKGVLLVWHHRTTGKMKSMGCWRTSFSPLGKSLTAVGGNEANGNHNERLTWGKPPDDLIGGPETTRRY